MARFARRSEDFRLVLIQHPGPNRVIPTVNANSLSKEGLNLPLLIIVPIVRVRVRVRVIFRHIEVVDLL
jgi:hypothetical protein